MESQAWDDNLKARRELVRKVAEMEWRTLEAALKGHLRAIFACIFLGAIAAYGLASLLPSYYRATATISITTTGLAGTQNLLNAMPTFTRLASADPVILGAAQSVGVEPTELMKSISVESPPNTLLISVAATSREQNAAESMAEAVAASLIAEVARVSEPIGEEARPRAFLTQKAYGVQPRDTGLWLALGAGFGLAISIVAVTFRVAFEFLTSDPSSPSARE